mgnify:CR=1 FL=1
MTRKPEILAPAGDTQSFLAAMAAGADAVYLGLKHFSARMQADNFGSAELSRMVELANENGRRVYVAFNTLVKPDDVPAAGRLIARLARDVKPHGLIIQDPGVLALARQAGYEGGLFLSTLANLTHPASLLAAKELGADRVILPRELSIDEVKQISAACPEGLDLEMFIHGALCWCVSGRCYWSSYMGGKSGLRGRCVQPCRRVYKQRNHSGRFFSCLDLSLDVLAKTITDIPHLSCWKIEGRKKGPHYVYHVVTAYKMLRDNPDDPQARKDAEKILEMALGRPSTRAAIIETLFKRNYIRKERKNLFPTATGVELIDTIQEELLKSAELTGLWEKKLRQIERGTYEARTFLEELKLMVHQVVINVLSDQTGRTITIEQAAPEKPQTEKEPKGEKTRKPRAKKEKTAGQPESTTVPVKPVCPICKKGSILRGKTAYGCSEYKDGCTFRMDYATYGEGLSDEELVKVISGIRKD